MQKKRITLEQWTEIGRYNHAAKWCRRLCSYYLIKSDDKYIREQSISWPIYILIFIPIHILQALVCCWDGGLREFIIFPRFLGSDPLHKYDLAFERAEKVWNSLDK